MIRSCRAPAFWWQDEPRGPERVLTFALAPLGAVYGFVAARRMRRAGYRAPLPVLCVGNFVVGGAGKTPLAIALARRLIAAGETPFILSRGYRSAAEHGPPILVDLAKHSAQDVGDEPLLLARVAPTLVSADRVASARLAVARGASLLILDDGLQNPALAKDMRLVAVDAVAGIGNGLCLPAGPLRAPLPDQLDFASALAIIGAGRQGGRLADEARRLGKPVIDARLAVAADEARLIAGRRVYAFAGIGRPAKFFASLSEAGACVVAGVPFPDHYFYRRDDIIRLQRAAKEQDALLVTTEKDFVRLRPLEALIDPALSAPVPVTIELRFEEPGLVDDLLAQSLGRARALTSPI